MANGTPGAPPPQVIVPGAGWVDMFSRVIVQVGFPVVVAGVLLWFLLTKFQDNMNAITTRMGNNTTVVEKLIANEEATVAELKAETVHMQKQTDYLKTIVDSGQLLLQYHQQELAELRGLREGKQEGKQP
jgi:hypothetical protein